MNKAVPRPLWLVTRPIAIEGFLHGLRHPSLMAVLGIDAAAGQDWTTEADVVLAGALAAYGAYPEWPAVAAPDTDPATAVLLRSIHRLQLAAGLPIARPGMVIGRTSGQPVVILPVTGQTHQVHVAFLHWLLRLFELLAAGKDPAGPLGRLPDHVTGLGRQAQWGANEPRFLRAAAALGLPSRELPGRILQFGDGRRARWMESSFTDRTPRLAASLARNKDRAAAMLRMAGIPVPDHVLVLDEEAALKAAERLGYPVVTKPADKDGGLAVSAGLVSPDEVRAGFALAHGVSPNVLVEKHYDGRDYRMVVFNSELLWSYERVPGGVVGDGILTVARLVERQNVEQNRSVGHLTGLTPLVLDDEAQALLARENLGPDSVPEAGRFVRLRRAANIASGGLPVGGIHEHVHPDNRRLAIRAAEALRLDLAGVDLLIPDIARSWHETGAMVCEVNGQPNLGLRTSAHVYGQILSALVEGDGRIPVVVVAGNPPDEGLARTLAADLAGGGLTVGLADSAGASIAGEMIATGPDALAAGMALMTDRRVDAVVMAAGPPVLRSGLACDRFDVLVITASLAMAGPKSKELRSLLFALLPMCASVVSIADLPPLPLPRTGEDGPKVLSGIPPDRIAAVVADLVDKAVRRHGAVSLPRG